MLRRDDFALPPASRRTVGTALIVVALLATAVSLLLPAQLFNGNRSVAAARQGWLDDGRGTWSTPYGPLTALDRDFVRKVRLAGLWELPAGRQAQERGIRESVRTAGDTLVRGHTELDQRAIEAARALGIALPNQPTDRQQELLARMDGAEGEEFEQQLANILRLSHGKVFGLIAIVRHETQNSLVRSLADRANTIVLQHITVLENTGLVDFEPFDDHAL